LTPQAPWHGYDLGAWTEELENQARMATRGDYYALGAKLSAGRRSGVEMNTPIDTTTNRKNAL